MLREKKIDGRPVILQSRHLKNGWIRQGDFEKGLARRLGIPVADSHKITRAFIDELKDWILHGFRVKFRGFGSFGTKVKGGRTFYNHLLDGIITTEVKRYVKFDQSRKFTEELNEKYSNDWQQYADNAEGVKYVL